MNWMRLNDPCEDLCEGLDRQGLGESRHALEQEVAAGKERDEHAFEHRVLADDDPSDLVEDGLARGARIGGRLGTELTNRFGHGTTSWTRGLGKECGSGRHPLRGR